MDVYTPLRANRAREIRPASRLHETECSFSREGDKRFLFA
jgi:hypothetical protein